MTSVAEGATRPDQAPPARSWAGRGPSLLLGAGVCTSLVSIAAANGGYFPTSWGWSALGFAWVALLLLLLADEVELTREGVAFLAGTLALTGWTFASTAWSWDLPQSVLEGERSLVYATAVSVLLLAGRGRQRALLAATLAAVTLICAYSLATRLFPAHVGRFDSTAGYRLFTPVGYWNSLGLFAAIGSLLALGFVARALSLAAKAVAAAALVLLVPTIYFTFSRGSWLALGIALAFCLLLDPRRLQASLATLVAAAAPAVAVLIASRSKPLTTIDTPLAAAHHDGLRLALAIALLLLAAALLGAAFGVAERRLSPSRPLRLAYGFALLLAIAVCLAVVWAREGSPPTLARRAWHSFTAHPPATGQNLNNRLFRLSNNGRIELWHAALHQSATARVAGTGAGTFEIWWDEHRPDRQQVRDAHSLYLETLAELGIFGLALLALILGAPLVGAFRRRASPLIPFAAAGFVAFCVHAAMDWDWEVAAVTLAGLACAAALVLPERRAAAAVRVPVRLAGVAAALAVAGFALVAAVGNRALASANDGLRQGSYFQAELAARRAARWMPWAADPWLLVGEIEGASFRPGQARRSLEKAAKKEPRSYLAWYALSGQTSGAEQRHAAAQVVRLNPLSDEAAEMRTLLAERP